MNVKYKTKAVITIYNKDKTNSFHDTEIKVAHDRNVVEFYIALVDRMCVVNLDNYNRTKVWLIRRVSEGLGLPLLDAKLFVNDLWHD